MKVNRDALTQEEWAILNKWIKTTTAAFGEASKALDSGDYEAFVSALTAVDNVVVSDGMTVFSKLLRAHVGQNALDQVADVVGAKMRFDPENSS